MIVNVPVAGLAEVPEHYGQDNDAVLANIVSHLHDVDERVAARMLTQGCEATEIMAEFGLGRQQERNIAARVWVNLAENYR